MNIFFTTLSETDNVSITSNVSIERPKSKTKFGKTFHYVANVIEMFDIQHFQTAFLIKMRFLLFEWCKAAHLETKKKSKHPFLLFPELYSNVPQSSLNAFKWKLSCTCHDFQCNMLLCIFQKTFRRMLLSLWKLDTFQMSGVVNK